MFWKNNIKKLHPTLIVLSIIFLVMGYGTEVLIFLIALFLHELAHWFVAKRFGYKLVNFYLMPYGACLSYNETFLEREEILIALAGPITNLFMCIVIIALWWIIPISYAYTYYFVQCNFYLALFNFLPCYPLDAGRILKAIVKNKFSYEKAIKVTKILCYIFSFIFFVMFVISCFILINFNFLMISILLFLGIFDTNFQGKYEKIYVDKEKLLEKGIAVKCLAVNGNYTLLKAYKKFSSTKYNILYIVIDGKVKLITENNLEKLIRKHSPTTTFNEIYSDD